MRNWKDIVISPQTPLKMAIHMMDKGALRILLVTDSENTLLGTVTDGDIRRALLASLDLQTPITQVMHKNPSVAFNTWSATRMRKLMQQKSLLHLPVVDESGQLLRLETLEKLLYPEARKNSVLLMAGGLGTRLRPLTENCPKPLLKVGGKPILEIILENFINSGFNHFYISVCYLAEMIKSYFGDGSQWGVKIDYINEEKPLGTGGVLGLLPHQDISSPLIMMNGDLLTNIDFGNLLDFHEEHQGLATLGVREYEYQVPYGVIEADSYHVKSIVEKPAYKFFVNAGIYVLQPELVQAVPQGQFLDMPNLFENKLGEGEKINMFPIHEYWLDIGRLDDFQRAQMDINSIIM